MGETLLYKADNQDGTYKNPILFADYSDPDVIRVGDTYYMTASSFNYIPGLPILISKDLVNWKLVNYAIDRIPVDFYDIPKHAKGVWAPSIRFHEGKFYIYYGMPDEGIYMVCAKDPLGKWEEPVCVLEGKGLIDSCPFWDEDGKAYVIHGYANSRIGFKSCLGIFEMSPDGKRAITEDHIFYNGWDTQPTIEGPKVYKREGEYYILAPAGGVKQGWQLALRSKNIYGPYETKTVLKQGDTKINGPHQGGLVDTVNGDEWFVHFQDVGFCGRITHLQPVTWIDGWPSMGEKIKDYCGVPVEIYKKPNTGIMEAPAYLDASDDFHGGTLNLCWQWMGNFKESFYSFSDNKLRLYALNPAKEQEITIWNCSNVLTQKIVCPSCEYEVSFDFANLKDGEKAGFVALGGEYEYLAVKKQDCKYYLVHGESQGSFTKKTDVEEIISEISSNTGMRFGAILEEAGESGFKLFYVNYEGQRIFVNRNKSMELSSSAWVGAKAGIFSVGNNENPGFCEFEYFKVNNYEE